MQAEEIFALAKQAAHEFPPTELISCEYFLGAPHAHYKIHERQWPKPQQTWKDSRFEIIDSKAYGERRRVTMNRKEKVMGNQAHSQRRWREVPKDELDTWPGKPVPVDKATELMRKKNKRVEARRRAAKRLAEFIKQRKPHVESMVQRLCDTCCESKVNASPGVTAGSGRTAGPSYR
jgi:hypothetical protein